MERRWSGVMYRYTNLKVHKDKTSQIEVRDPRTGYLGPVRDGPGTSPDLESCWDVAAVAAVIIFPGACSQNGFFRK